MNRDPRATPHPVGPSGPQAPPRLPRGGPVPTNGDSRCVISRRTVGWPERNSLPFACSESLGAKNIRLRARLLPRAHPQASAVGDRGALRADDGWGWPAATEARRDAAARAWQCGPHAAGLISGGSLRMTVHGRVCVSTPRRSPEGAARCSDETCGGWGIAGPATASVSARHPGSIWADRGRTRRDEGKCHCQSRQWLQSLDRPAGCTCHSRVEGHRARASVLPERARGAWAANSALTLCM